MKRSYMGLNLPNLPSTSSLLEEARKTPAWQQALTQEKIQQKQAVDTFSTILIGGAVGAVVGGGAGALLWKSHRIIGFLLGSILVGAPAGAAIGTVVASKKLASQ